MAVKLTDQKLYVSMPIVKMEEVDDGIVIYGKASDGRIDSDDQVVSSDWSGPAIQKWLETGGNVRCQHNPQLLPAGKGLSVEIDKDGDGAHWVKSLIVEPTAMKLVRHGVLRAYSVGIAKPVIKRDITGKARGGIVAGGEIAEISLVDRPANDGCGITLVKSADDNAPWTHGDLVDLLVKAEANALLTKAQNEDVPDQDKADDKPNAADAQDSDVEETEPDTEPDDDEDDKGDGKPEDMQKAYAAARAEWVAREPKPPAADIGSGTAFLAKRAAMQLWEAWDTEGAELGLDGTSRGYQVWVAKRNFDANVGGGVDRDQLDAQDFIDPEGRRFPIHSPGDVSDAVSSYGRANPLIPMRKFRARLRAIAKRKGPEFEAALPESWAGKNFTTTSPNATGLVPYNLQGQAEPFAGARHKDDEDEDKEDVMTPDLVKGGKSCKKCGKGYDADAKLRRCEGCGKKLPKAMMMKGAVIPDLVKAGVHNWKHGWVWVGAGPNPRMHEHMAAHHEAMSKGKFAEAAGHMHAAALSASARTGHDSPERDYRRGEDIAAQMMHHHGEIASHAPAESGKMTAAEAKMHSHLAEAHRAAASGDAAKMGHHLSEATAGKQRLERRHGVGKPKSTEVKPEAGTFIGNVPSTHGNARPVLDSRPGVQNSRGEGFSVGDRVQHVNHPGGGTVIAHPRTPRGGATVRWDKPGSGPAVDHYDPDVLKPKRITPGAAAGRELGHAMAGEGPGHDSFDGRSRAAWQKDARNAGVKPPRNAPAHHIAGMVGEHHARNVGGDPAAAQFRAAHDAKVSRLGDPMGIYPTPEGNRAARDAAVARTQQQLGHIPATARGAGVFSTDPKIREATVAQIDREAADVATNRARAAGVPTQYESRRTGDGWGVFEIGTGQQIGYHNTETQANRNAGDMSERAALNARQELAARSTGVEAPSARSLASSRYARQAAQAQAERAAVSQGRHTIQRADRSSGYHVLGPGAPGKDKKFASRAEAEFQIDQLTGQPAGTTRQNTRPLKRVKSLNGGIMGKGGTALPPDTAVDTLDADDDTLIKSEAPYGVQRMHDALCPVYNWADVADAYPSLTGIRDALDPQIFNDAVLKAADQGDATGIVWAGVLHDNADLIAQGHIEPALLADARADLVKTFGAPPQPDDYRRGYISAGHAPAFAPTTRVPMVPPAVHTIHPDDFHRGLITEGHQAESPSDHGDNLSAGTTASGAARQFYATASRGAVSTTMKALHDHLIDTIPGMCHMADSRHVMPPDMQANNRPMPVDPDRLDSLIGKSHSDNEDDDTTIYEAPAVPAATAGISPKKLAKLIKNAVAEATKSLHDTYQHELDAIRDELDELGAQPDPTQAPIRGAVMVAKAQTTEPTAAPVERISLVEQAQMAKAAADAEYVVYLQKMAGSDNPSIREQANAQLGSLLTKIS